MLQAEVTLAVQRGDEVGVRGLVASGHAVNACDTAGCTALHFAAAAKQAGVAQVLVELGADPLLANARGETPLHVAQLCGHRPTLVVLAGSLLRAPQGAARRADAPGREDWDRELVDAVDQEHANRVYAAIAQGANMDVMAPRRLLALAARRGSVSVVQVLLMAGADPNAVDDHLTTPLMVAAWYGREAAARVLLEAGASLTVASEHGVTPAHYAAFRGSTAILGLFFAHDPGTRTQLDAQGSSPVWYAMLGNKLPQLAHLFVGAPAWDPHLLHFGAEFASIRTLEVLLQLMGSAVAQTALNERNSTTSGDTPAHIAARLKRRDVCAVFERHGADMGAKNKAGVSPRELLAFAGSTPASERPTIWTPGWTYHHPDVRTTLEDQLLALVKNPSVKLSALEELLQTSVNVNGRGTMRSETPLHVAVKHATLEAVPLLLLSAGALVNASSDEEGVTPLMVAAASSNALVFVPLLLRHGADLAQTDCLGQNALIYAVNNTERLVSPAMYRHFTVQMVAQTDSSQQNVLHALGRCPGHSVDLLRTLLSLPLDPADVNRVCSSSGDSPLSLLIKSQQFSLVEELLLDHRTDVNAATPDKVPPLNLLILHLKVDDISPLTTFLSRRPALNATDALGFTALHLAYSRGLDSAVAALVSAGCDGSRRAKDGRLPVEMREERRGVLSSLFRRSSKRANSPVKGRAGDVEEEPEDDFVVVAPGPEASVPPVAQAAADKLFQLYDRFASRGMRGAGSGASTAPSVALAPIAAEPTMEPVLVDVVVESAFPRDQLIGELKRTIESIIETRAFVQPGLEAQPPAIRDWRVDVDAIREAQQQTAHNEHSLSAQKLLRALDEAVVAVETLVTDGSKREDVAAAVARRDALRAQAEQALAWALASGDQLEHLQLKEEARILGAEADKRQDDHRVAQFAVHVRGASERREELSCARDATATAELALLMAMRRELVAFDKWKSQEAEMREISRLCDQRAQLERARQEHARHADYLADARRRHSVLAAALSKSAQATLVATELAQATKNFQRAQLELDQSRKWLELLSGEEDPDAPAVTSRVAQAKDKYAACKQELDAQASKADSLRREFPEVVMAGDGSWRGGAVLSLESFANLVFLRSPDIRVGERDGNKVGSVF